jgi:hypothetical protein
LQTGISSESVPIQRHAAIGIPHVQTPTYLSCMKKPDDAAIQHQLRYDGLTLYLPDASQLRRGDILLTRCAEGDSKWGLAQAKLIRAASGGEFDHALICTAPPTFGAKMGR